MKVLPAIIAFAQLIISCNTGQQKNSMTLDELLLKQKDQYMATYRLGLNQSAGKPAQEVLLQLSADQNGQLPEVYQINRYDMVTRDADGQLSLTEFNIDKDSVLKYPTQVYDIKGMKLTVDPFVWNGCEITIDKKPPLALEAWAKKWINIDDNKQPDTEGFQHVIHSITFPEEKNGSWTFAVDFGSSAPEAFKELMTILSDLGIKETSVHSKTFNQ